VDFSPKDLQAKVKQLHGANENRAGGINCHFTEVNMTNLDPRETVLWQRLCPFKERSRHFIFQNETLD
jgi:hypothetical protein